MLCLACDCAELLAELHRQCFAGLPQHGAWHQADMEALLVSPYIHGYVLQNEAGQPLGMALLQCLFDDAELLTIGILPQARKQGAGQVLVAQLCQRAHAQGATRLILEVAEDNLPARALYARCGFSLVGRRAAYYQTATQSSDALVLQRDLGDSQA